MTNAERGSSYPKKSFFYNYLQFLPKQTKIKNSAKPVQAKARQTLSMESGVGYKIPSLAMDLLTDNC